MLRKFIIYIYIYIYIYIFYGDVNLFKGSLMGQNIQNTTRGLIGHIWLYLVLANFVSLLATKLQYLGANWALNKLNLEAIP